MSNDFNKRPIIVMDFETTGIDSAIHDIIEIGAVAVDHNLSLLSTDGSPRMFKRKIQIEHPETIQPEALKVNGYTPEAWKNADTLFNAIWDFEHWAVDGIFCAWNITFEYRFLTSAYNRLGRTNPFLERRYSHHIDIPSIAWFDGSGTRDCLDYDQVSKDLGIEPEPRPHRALNGAFHNLEVLRALRLRKLCELT